LAACGGDTVDVNNVDPRGSVGGIIVDASTREPLAGVSITLLAGGRVFDPAVTAEDGSFQFEKVPGGDVILTVAALDGYNGAMIRGTLPTSAGDFPLGNATLTLGPIGVLPAAGTFRFRVLDELGAPVSSYPVGVELQLQYVDYSSGTPDGEGQIYRQVQTDADGYATVPGMPDFFALGSVPDAVLVFLPPLDANSDGVYEFPGGDAAFNMRSLDPTPDVILDASLAATLTVRASTVPQLASGGSGTPAVVQPSGDIHITFNLPIQADAAVTMSDESGLPIAVPTSALAIRDDTMRISLGSLGLDFNNEYNLTVHAVAAVGERFVIGDFAASFFTVSADTNVSVAGASRDGATQVVTVNFNEPIGLGNVGSQSVLGSPNCVVFFGFDINGANGQGDFVNELGSDSCDVAFFSDEIDPPGLPTLSGFSKRWTFTAPLQTSGTAIPGGITVHLLFDRVPSGTSVTERTDGRPVQNLTFTLP
jgi:hypothetical protein